jgi:hypothetical protein
MLNGGTNITDNGYCGVVVASPAAYHPPQPLRLAALCIKAQGDFLKVHLTSHSLNMPLRFINNNNVTVRAQPVTAFYVEFRWQGALVVRLNNNTTTAVGANVGRVAEINILDALGPDQPPTISTHLLRSPQGVEIPIGDVALTSMSIVWV